MSDIQFDEPGLDYMRKYADRKPAYSTLAGMLIKAGFAKDESQASIVMVVIAIVALGMAYIFWPGSGSNTDAPPLYVDSALEAQRLNGEQ